MLRLHGIASHDADHCALLVEPCFWFGVISVDIAVADMD